MSTNSIFQSVLDRSTDVCCILNAKHQIIWVNKMASKQLGLPKTPPNPILFSDILPSNYNQIFKETLQEIALKLSNTGGFKCVHQVGNSLSLELKWNFSYDSNSQCWYATGVDVSNSKLKIKGAASKFKNAYRSLFTKNNTPKWIYDEGTSTILDVNKGALKCYGYSKKEFLALSLDNLYGEKGLATATKARENNAKKGKSIALGVLDQTTKNGKTIKMQISEQRINVSACNCILVTCLDVTDSFIAQQLESLELEIMKQIAAVSFDVKKVLNDYVKGLEFIFPDVKVSILAIADKKISDLAYYSLPSAYMTGFNGVEIGAKVGSCGTAAYTKNMVIVEDISSDPLWENFKGFALGFGLKACWSYPVMDSNSNVIATIANYYLTTKKPTRVELELFNRSASFISIILENDSNRKKIESNLELYNYVNQATSDAIYDWDLQKDFIQWGKSFERLFGHKIDSELNNDDVWKNLIHSNDYESSKKSLITFLKDPEQNNWQFEYYLKKSDNTYVFVKSYGYVIRDAKGRAVRMIGVLSDATKSKLDSLNKEVLSDFNIIFNESETLYQALQGVVKNKSLQSFSSYSHFDGIEVWLSNRDSTKLLLMASSNDNKNPHFEEGSATAMINYGEGLPGLVWEKKQPVLWNTAAINKQKSGIESGIKNAVGLPIYVNNECLGVLVFLSKFKNESFTNLQSVWKEITTPLGADIKRKQLKEEMDRIFSLAPVMICLFDFEGRVKRINPSGCKLLEYTEEELGTFPFMDLVYPDDTEKTLKALSDIATNAIDSSKQQIVTRYITKSGKIIWLDWNYTFSKEERLIYAVARDVTETVNLQDLLDKATSLAQIGGWEIDMSSKSVYWSKITRDIHEVDDDYVPNLEDGINFYREDVRPKILEKVNEAVENGSQWDFEYPIITGKGNEVWIRSIGQCEFVNGECKRLYGSFQNIHKSKTSEIELKRAFKEKNEILERIGDAFFAMDNNWNVIYWNGVAEQLTNTLKEDVLGKNLWVVFEDAIDSLFYTNYNRAKEQGVAVHFEEYYPTVNRWFEVSAYPSNTGISVYFKDISSRKFVEKEIKESNERFEKVSQATNDAIWDWDIANNKLYLGEGFRTFFGQEAIGIQPTLNLWEDNIHPDDYEETTLSLHNATKDGDNEHWQHEYRYLNQKDNTYAHVIDRGAIIRDKHKKAIRMVGAIADITHRVEHEQELKALNESLEYQTKELLISNADLEQFAYVASHDLQEPLRMITGFLTRLEQKYKDELDAKAQQYIYFAVDGASRMRQIILDLLEYSRVGRQDNIIELVNTKEVVDEAIALNNKRVTEKKAIFNIGELPILNSYRAPVLQVFQNLISNALKYAKVGVTPEISISSKLVNDTWEFAVSDNGIGIEKEYHEKIFIIFQRLHNKDDYEGTGIGLSIIKKIVDNLNGKIWLESQENKGSTFYFTLPKNK
ncbi:PAS domain S-box protein [Mariniflexile sp. AS56]|uniref:PAS domain S-box protein n=1 Tax=Mariniflexile sp. AS56 TaxID=3063957 RepID=UPI0026F34E85|nr:PAS domain S-box protein [Mariniflexile sp. AS56]MDO7173266.1 PAS domain S-box protein [Mariniflexile sp. AS56]